MDDSWTTQMEIGFLARLGQHYKGSLPMPPRLELLLMYRLYATERRHDWGTMNKAEVLAALERYIAVEMRQREIS